MYWAPISGRQTIRPPLPPETLRWFAAMGGWGRFSISVVVFIVICAAAVWIFNREAPRIAEEL